MERIKKIYFPVFGYTIIVVVTDDVIKSRSKRDSVIGSECELKNMNITALFSCNINREKSFVFLKEGASIDTITHECYHAVQGLMDWLNAGNEPETFAHHLGYLTQEVFDFIKLKGKNKK